ncbi:MAG: pantoate--beta-alanine ligase, partial [Bacteroidota bacterium]|nr:pantoate--beta-alanine ligase [Bacteroidota bacterium]
MRLYKTVRGLQNYLDKVKLTGQTVSFVPTMGALHEGHLSLIRIANQQAEISVASIFINPSQFNNIKDLQKYPRTINQDMELLSLAGCKVLFLPTIKEVYPKGLDTGLDLDARHLENRMEGVFRPGHFKGMLQVVKRLLDIVKADILIMGQKDFQQFSLVAFMIKELGLKVKLIIAPTIREIDGLAMSSRNLRLSPSMRKIVPVIYQCLLEAKANL